MAKSGTVKEPETPVLPDGVIWKGNPKLVPLLVPVSELHEDQSNANTHPERSLSSIAGSYQDFGQQKPIVCDANNIVRDGNGQLKAAVERLGWTHVAVLPSDLDDLNITRYALAVNRTAQHAEWDFETLSGHLRAIQEQGGSIDNLGWADYELEPLLQATWTPPEITPLPEGDQHGQDMGDPIIVTKDQRTIIDRAIESVRGSEGSEQLTEGRCLELICVRQDRKPSRP